MKVLPFPNNLRQRAGLIEKLRQLDQKQFPQTEFVYAHYYGEDWSLEELQEMIDNRLKKP